MWKGEGPRTVRRVAVGTAGIPVAVVDSAAEEEDSTSKADRVTMVIVLEGLWGYPGL